jgi:simple sugar transport system permease protein
VDEVIRLLSGASFWAATLRIATPLIFGTLGQLLCQRAGVLNLGIEGIMVLGAMSGWIAVHFGTSLWSGVLVAALSGAVLGLLLAFLTVPLALSQHVTGIGMSLFGTSLAYYLFRLLIPEAARPTVVAFRPINFPLLEHLPVVGPVLASQTALTYLAFLSVPVVSYVIYRMPIGLALRMVGENPEAAAAQGVSVVWVRTSAVVVGSALMAVGGAFLTLSAFNAFYFGMINGRGWICVALVVVASWRPSKALLAAVMFAAADALQLRLQQIVHGLPYQTFLMLPYVLGIFALIALSRSTTSPRALMIPYRAGAR